MKILIDYDEATGAVRAGFPDGTPLIVIVGAIETAKKLLMDQMTRPIQSSNIIQPVSSLKLEQ